MKKTKRLVLDTNLLVSAAILPSSVARKVFEKALPHTLLLSWETLQELETVLQRKKFDKYLSSKDREDFLKAYVQLTELVQITRTITACRDAKDNKFLELAVSGKADAIVTGDADLLALHPFEQIDILLPATFLEL